MCVEISKHALYSFLAFSQIYVHWKNREEQHRAMENRWKSVQWIKIMAYQRRNWMFAMDPLIRGGGSFALPCWFFCCRKLYCDTPLKTNMSPENQWLIQSISYWNSPFLGAMLVSGSVACVSPLLVFDTNYQVFKFNSSGSIVARGIPKWFHDYTPKI